MARAGDAGNGAVTLIAEAGVNHNGSLETALAMVDAAATAGADAIKFQTFTAEGLATADAPRAGYQRDAGGQTVQEGGQRAMLAALELDPDAHRVLAERSAERGVEFLSSPFDVASVELLAGLGMTTFKVPSGQITDLPYLRAVAGRARRVLLSTGMATLDEVRSALDALAEAGATAGSVTLLQCTTAYPAPPGEANLRAMVAMRDTFGVPVGYSDHTLGVETAVAAVALGASVVEKHFTLDKDAPGPDHRASADPSELAELVLAVRTTQEALGDGVKRPSASESENIAAARKSIVAARDIASGEVLTEDNLTTKRPGVGMSPMRWDEVVGLAAPRDFAKDEVIAL